RVGSDWEQFCRLHAQGRRSRAVQPLQEGLELVRDRPFADVVAGPGYGWLHLEGHLHHMEAEIVDAADLAAQLFLEHGDPVAARWAANRGLVAGPYAERLWVRLMAVADALGEAQEVERILVEMDRRLDLEGDYDQLHPDTLDAYRRYSRRNDRRRVG
ncbi:MAG TPA: bacterial transcriptional activator domain-containing protein, partial [Acidimicrobiales bacterium]